MAKMAAITATATPDMMNIDFSFAAFLFSSSSVASAGSYVSNEMELDVKVSWVKLS